MHDADGTGVADGWYSLVPGMVHPPRAYRRTPLLRRVPGRVVQALASVGPARGVLLFAASTQYAAVGVCREEPGSATLLVLRALFGRRRKVVMFQFILHERRHPARALIRRVDRWATRRALLRGHALTRFEVPALAAHYGLEASRFAYVPWPLAGDDLPPLPAPPVEALVLCAGRAYCDWPTVFAAARDAGWPLAVVCDERDRAEVQRLNADAGSPAVVHVMIPREEFLALAGRATVSIVSIAEREVSSGHIRVADAFSRGVPVVASATRSLEGYVRDGVDGLLVAPGDPVALRAAVDRLLDDPAFAGALRAAAFERAAGYRESDYFTALADLVAGRDPRLPAAAPLV